MSVPVQRKRAVELEKLIEQVPVWAGEAGLTLLPALPEPAGLRVRLEGDEVNAAAFCDLARTCGARILYLLSEAFEAAEFAVLEDDDSDGDGVEEQLSADARRELERIRRTALTRDGQFTGVFLCFVAEGVAHYWCEVAPWHTELEEDWAQFTALNRASQGARAEDAQARAAAEVDRIAAELAGNPEFRSAAKRSHHHDIAATAYPPPADADDDQLQEHQRIVRWATSQAIDAVEQAGRRIYAGYERDLNGLAEQIAAAGIVADATTVAARSLLLSVFLTEKSSGYPPPKRFMDLLMLRPPLRKPRKNSSITGQLPLD
ncbi:hypothetical protein J7I97_24940 [Streptomyces sp. ISL-87]|uniref:hypothetical protein n=1 Tax=Streptomyces sp. ISL-87 TaxID=2819188 RepID=UPI001BE82F48|nr:hypothetical protein [Streptomyces sp. ISL-87]MBT2611415.1 hypothetical protein [Streptomyces sp. ISL-87]